MISWCAKKKSVTFYSSAEAEYNALADSSCEVLWLQNLLTELTILVCSVPTPLFCDNKAAIDLTANPIYHARTKPIELNVQFIRDKIAFGLIKVIQIASKGNLANLLIKGQGKC